MTDLSDEILAARTEVEEAVEHYVSAVHQHADLAGPMVVDRERRNVRVALDRLIEVSRIFTPTKID